MKHMNPTRMLKMKLWKKKRKKGSRKIEKEGIYGKALFNKYCKTKSKQKIYRLSADIATKIKGDTDEQTLENIRKYSTVYARVIEQILKTDGKCFIYCSIVQGSGIILLSLLLELFGFKKATGKN